MKSFYNELRSNFDAKDFANHIGNILGEPRPRTTIERNKDLEFLREVYKIACKYVKETT